MNNEIGKEKSNVGTSVCINGGGGNNNSSTLMRSRRYNSSPVRPRRLVTKETVPTALVSPQTVQVTVQPPMLNYNGRLANSSATSYPKLSTPFQSRMHYVNDFTNSMDLNVSAPCAHYASYSELPYKYSTPNLHENNLVSSCSSNTSLMSDSLMLNSAVSDERLESLEKRMRYLESRLQGYENFGSVPTSISDGRLSNRNHSRGSDYRSAQSSCTNLLNSSQMYSGIAIDREIEALKEKIKKLQFDLDSERRLVDKQLQQHSKELLCKVDENETLRCKVKELKSENQLWKDRFHSFNKVYYQPMAVEELIKEKDTLRDTIKELECKLEEAEKLHKVQNNEKRSKDNMVDQMPPIDQFVSLEKYRLLKAKSKKLLTEKCRSLRAEILEKDSIKVQLQLQNAELSELRKAVYEPSRKGNCDCATTDNNLVKNREELMKLAQNCQFAASCILGVCEDVSVKKCPDYDQILGLKSATGASNSDQKMDRNALANSQLYYEKLLENFQILRNDLTRVQRLMVDYYSNELVDAIDCKVQ